VSGPVTYTDSVTGLSYRLSGLSWPNPRVGQVPAGILTATNVTSPLIQAADFVDYSEPLGGVVTDATGTVLSLLEVPTLLLGPIPPALNRSDSEYLDWRGRAALANTPSVLVYIGPADLMTGATAGQPFSPAGPTLSGGPYSVSGYVGSAPTGTTGGGGVAPGGTDYAPYLVAGGVVLVGGIVLAIGLARAG
jgi:hypothetical protein